MDLGNSRGLFGRLGQESVANLWQWIGFGLLATAALATFAAVWLLPVIDDGRELIGELKRAEKIPPQLQQFAQKPDPGSMVALPPVPLARSAVAGESANLLLNSSFEKGQSPWVVTGSTASGSPTDLLAADGGNSFQMLPPVSDRGALFQIVNLGPRTFYLLSAMLYVPGAGETMLQVRDATAATEVLSDAIAGAASQWIHASSVFVTGMKTKDASVGIQCTGSAGSSPILIDDCALHALASKNYIDNGTMEVELDPEQAPAWYFRGRPAQVVEGGYESERALELPLLGARASSLACLVPRREELAGRAVWLSAMAKCLIEDGTPPPITITLITTGPDGEAVRQSTTISGSDDWVEVALGATMPEQSPEKAAETPPFDILQFECPAGSRGRVLIDDVVMLGVPDGHFSGGLALADNSR